MNLGPEKIDLINDSPAVRDRKVAEAVTYNGLRFGRYSEVQAHNAIRTMRSVVLLEVAKLLAEKAKGVENTHYTSGLWVAELTLRRRAAEARAERTYPDRQPDASAGGEKR